MADVFPSSLIYRENPNLRLGIKSSLNSFKQLLASLYIIYKSCANPSKVLFSEEVNVGDNIAICLSKKLYIPNSANEVIIGREGKKIENVEGLELVGRGIDGIVLKLNEEKVIKILKDNIELQKELNKMTYEKVIKFISHFV